MSADMNIDPDVAKIHEVAKASWDAGAFDAANILPLVYHVMKIVENYEVRDKKLVVKTVVKAMINDTTMDDSEKTMLCAIVDSKLVDTAIEAVVFASKGLMINKPAEDRRRLTRCFLC